MAEIDARPTLSLTASFPLDARFASTVGELASRLAVAAGMGESDASAMQRLVEKAFADAAKWKGVERAPAIDVSLCAGESTIDFSVSCGSATVLTLVQPRP